MMHADTVIFKVGIVFMIVNTQSWLNKPPKVSGSYIYTPYATLYYLNILAPQSPQIVVSIFFSIIPVQPLYNLCITCFITLRTAPWSKLASWLLSLDLLLDMADDKAAAEEMHGAYMGFSNSSDNSRNYSKKICFGFKGMFSVQGSAFGLWVYSQEVF